MNLTHGFFAAAIAPALFASALLAQTHAAQSDVDLAFRPAPGSPQRYSITTVESKSVSVSTARGKAATTRSTVGVEIVLRERRDEQIVVDITLRSFACMGGNGKSATPSFDSKHPPMSGEAKVFADQVMPFIDRTVTAIVDETGAIVQVQGASSLPATPQRARMEAELFSLPALQQKVGPIVSTRAPHARAAIDMTWTSSATRSLTPTAAVGIESTYSLAGVADGLASIESTSTITFPPPPDASVAKLVLTKAQRSGTQLWDIESGVLNRATENELLVIRVEADQSSMVQTIETQTTIQQDR